MPSDLDTKFMRKAVSLARKGCGRTSPNPPVGAVIVKDGRMIGQGYHKKAGENHAEVNAINSLREDPEGSTIYVTLEPCNHHGRTPPCSHVVLKAGINRVVIGTRDPNPSVAGGGAQYLRENGLEVDIGCLEEECRYLVAPFTKHFIKGLPWVISKVACSMDGKIATRTGHSQWITNKAARSHGHRLRDMSDGILVGKGTALADDPSLTVRLKGNKGKDPLRFVLDSSLSIDLTKKIFQKDMAPGTWVIGCEGRADHEKAEAFKKAGVNVWLAPQDKNGRVNTEALLFFMAEMNIQSLLVEGGATIHGDFFDKYLVDEVFFFYAPIIIGGKNAKSAITGKGPATIDASARLHSVRQRKIEDNWLVHGLITEIDSFFRE